MVAMASNPKQFADAPNSGRRTTLATRLWGWLVDGLAAIGTTMIGLLMVIICADVVARNLLGASLPLVSELGALLLVMIVYLQLGTTIRHDRLARTDMFLTGFRRKHPRSGALLAAAFDLTGAAMLATMAWATTGIVARDLNSGEFIGVIGVATLPTWPFRSIIAAGLSVSALQSMIQVWAALRAAASWPEEHKT